MKRLSIVTLSVFLPFVALAAPACSSESSPDDGGNTTAGTGSNTSGTGGVLGPIAGTGSSTAGTASGGGGTGSSTAGTSSGGTTAGAAAGGGGMGGTASAGASPGGGGASTAGTGGAPNPGCLVKIDSTTPCTAVATCPDVYCGVFKLGSKDCACEMASGNFKCASCDYAGKTEEIVLPPAAALPACASDDTTLEATVGCTKGMRCRSTDAAKIRFCACWEDPVKGGTAWDCDALPASWPK